jgi:FMN phosphatase YigB (HAD superfamily)
MAPDRILLLDDNQLNVDGARAAGLRAERVIGVEEARRVLERVTALPPGPSD